MSRGPYRSPADVPEEEPDGMVFVDCRVVYPTAPRPTFGEWLVRWFFGRRSSIAT